MSNLNNKIDQLCDLLSARYGVSDYIVRSMVLAVTYVNGPNLHEISDKILRERMAIGLEKINEQWRLSHGRP